METSIETEPVPQDVSLERRGSTVVAVPREGRPALTAVEVEETIAQPPPRRRVCVSVVGREIQRVHGLAVSLDQQSLKILFKARPPVTRGCAAEKDPVRPGAHQNAV